MIAIFGVQYLLIGQIANGNWRDHLAYLKANNIANTPNKIYCAFEGSGLLSFNKNSGEIEKLSKPNYLSDIDISFVKYASGPEVLVLGYNNGNIDLITHEGLLNKPEIKHKSLTTTKTINNIECVGNYCYLACDFGIVVLDLLKMEIKDSYIFGPNGSTLQVNNVAISDEAIYAATELGLYKADLSSPNLLDYSNWELLQNVPETGTAFKFVEIYTNTIVAAYTSNNNNHDQIIILDKTGWKNWNIHTDTTINNIDEKDGLLSICGNTYSILVNEQMVVQHEFDLAKGTDILKDETGRIYLASKNGLTYMDGNDLRYITVNGPRFNSTSKVATMGDQVWVTSGGPFRIYKEGGAHNFSNEKWKSLNAGWNPGLENVGNLYKLVFDPVNPYHVYASAYIYGLYEIENFEVTKKYTWENTPLFQTTIEKNVGPRIMGLDFDSKGKLWAIMDETNQPVYTLDSEGNWENLELSSSIFFHGENYADLLVTSDDQVWILSKNDGIIVLKENDDGSITENNFAIRNKDGENLSNAYCIVEDKEGVIWIGTNRGPIRYSPSQTNEYLTNKEAFGNQIRIPRNDGTGLADFLLDYEVINQIAVDGGNRKWLATEQSGVFLISDDGKKTIHHFTDEFLFSNNVIGIGVQENTGEVIISTNLGVIGYMGTSTEGDLDFNDVYVYPNPIRPDYEGEITVRGLLYNTQVKITDVSGNLVYETISYGGQAVWDGKDFNGQRVHTGVYLVFLSNEDGSKTHVTKLLFIH